MMKNKKGITLVEVIVVLIIMAVLAGILVASYTGYIDKAKNDAALVEARAVYLAATTKYHELYATDATTDGELTATVKTDVEKLASVATGSVLKVVVSKTDKKVTTIWYKASNNMYCVYNGTAWTVQANSPT